MKTGIQYGFSIGGSVTSVFREFNEKMKKEIYVLDDGELFHVSLTTQPANAKTFAQAISKCIKSGIHKQATQTEERVVTFKHSSNLFNGDEPDKIDYDGLPEQAFPIDRLSKTLYKDYPHHFVDNDMLYLHKGLLESALYKAVEVDAPKAVIAHLTNHLQVVGLNKKVDEIMTVAKSLDRFEEVKTASDALVQKLSEFFNDISEVEKLAPDLRANATKAIIDKVGEEIESIINVIERM